MPLRTMSEGSDNTDPAIEAALRTLSGCLVQRDWKATYLSHKEVYKIGRPAIVPIRNALQQMRRGEIDDAGNYTPFLCNINVVWDCPYSLLNPVSYIDLFYIETTLSHEIGHHINKHTFGPDDVQEKEADAYKHYLLT